jgi:hypothetical protein
MQVDWKQSARRAIASGLVMIFAVPPAVLAQTHVVDSTELQKQLVAASQSRKENLEQVQGFLSLPAARKALKNAGVDEQQVKTAVAGMSDSELANLASRTRKAQSDFAAGTLSDRDLIIIILAVVALVLIIVAVR